MLASVAVQPPRVIRAFIVSQGEELLCGLTTDTNATFLAEQLTGLGLRVVGMSTAGDRVDDIAAVLRDGLQQAEVVVCTGGLGPTGDDLTAEGAASAFDLPLTLNDEAMRQIQDRYASLDRAMPESNRRQAMLPEGVDLVPNPLGTAPGFRLILEERGQIWCLPGVPSEMKAMWSETVASTLTSTLAPPAPLRHVFRVMGRAESALQDLLGELPQRFPGVELGFRTRMPENQVKLVAAPGDSTALQGAIHAVRELLGTSCFSEDNGLGLAGVVGQLLLGRGERLALAESCTGGLIAHLCISEAGSSAWLDRGFVTYSNESKLQHLGVPPDVLAEHGAVSEATVLAMAEGAARAAGSQWGLAVTGIAGPSGGSAEKPVGTVWLGVAGVAGRRARQLRLGRDRNSNRQWAAWIGLDMLRKQLIRAGQ